jgi:hypothetical protein
LLNLLPIGLKGLAFAALTAAIVRRSPGKPIVSPPFLHWIFIKKQLTKMPLKVSWWHWEEFL